MEKGVISNKKSKMKKILIIIVIAIVIFGILKIYSINQGYDSIYKMLNNQVSEKNEQENKEMVNNQNNEMTVEEAEEILKEKFEILEGLYLRPDVYFNTVSEWIEEYGYMITNYDEVINQNFTSEMKEYYEQNHPAILNYANDQVYIMNGGGFVEYNGLDGFYDIIINDAEIIANVVTNQMDIDGNEMPDVSTNIRLVKNGESWLIDSFDRIVFLDEINE